MLLSSLVIIPVVGAALVALAHKTTSNIVRSIALLSALLGVVVSVPVAVTASQGILTERTPWIASLGISWHLEADGLSALLVVVTALFGLIAVLASWREVKEKVASFHVWILLTLAGAQIVFLSRDAFLFYFGFELMLIPMVVLAAGWGGEQKLTAATKLFLFAFAGSLAMLASLLYIYVAYAAQTGEYSFALADLAKTNLSAREQWWLFLGLLIGLGVKLPIVPLHSWLTDYYTQAPTAAVLSSVMLKSGLYGLIRVANPLLPVGAAEFSAILVVLGLIGIFYGGVAAFVQRDLKRLLAYSSISHVGFILVGLYVGNELSNRGAVLQMVNHALATGGLFIVAGIVQERTRTRSLDIYGGLWRFAPVLGGFMLFFSFASLGLPGTGSFVGELYVIGGSFQHNVWLGASLAFAVLLAAAYSLRAFTATMHGPESGVVRQMDDGDSKEATSLFVPAVLLVVIGFFPALVTGMLSGMPPGPTVPARTVPLFAPRPVSPASEKAPQPHAYYLPNTTEHAS